MTPDVLRASPQILSTLRMGTMPPIARERLSGLAGVTLTLVKTLEGGTIPPRMEATDLVINTGKILSVPRSMHDDDLFPWVNAGRSPDAMELHRTANRHRQPSPRLDRRPDHQERARGTAAC